MLGGLGGGLGAHPQTRALGHRPGLSGTQLPAGPRAHADPRAVFAQGAQNYRLNPSPACTRNRRNPEPSPCCDPNRACLSCAPFREVLEPGSRRAGPLPLVFFSTWWPPDGNPRNCPSGSQSHSWPNLPLSPCLQPQAFYPWGWRRTEEQPLPPANKEAPMWMPHASCFIHLQLPSEGPALEVQAGGLSKHHSLSELFPTE